MFGAFQYASDTRTLRNVVRVKHVFLQNFKVVYELYGNSTKIIYIFYVIVLLSTSVTIESLNKTNRLRNFNSKEHRMVRKVDILIS